MTATADLPNKKIQDFTEKLSFVDGDMSIIIDSEDGNKLKKINKTLMKGDKGDPGTPWADGVDWTSVTFEWAYNALTAYTVGQTVSYNGSSYGCILNSTGNLPTNWTYWVLVAQKGTDWAGSGDMMKATYDPTNINASAFSMDNMVETATKKILTSTERTNLGNQSWTNTGDQSDATLTFTDITTNNASASKHGFLPKLDNTGTKYLRDDGTWKTVSWSGGFWTSVAGSPVRASNTTFTVTGDYTAVFKKGMVLKWTESSTVRNAMVSIPSTYWSPNTTVTIIGDTMASIGSSSLKYAMLGAEGFIEKFAIAGTIWATGTNIANSYYAREPMRVIGADLQVGTAGTTNSTTIDINKWGTTMFTTKPTLATTVASSPLPYTADTATSLALGDKVTIDVDAVQTTAAIDLYTQLYLRPTRLNDLT